MPVSLAPRDAARGRERSPPAKSDASFVRPVLQVEQDPALSSPQSAAERSRDVTSPIQRATRRTNRRAASSQRRRPEAHSNDLDGPVHISRHATDHPMTNAHQTEMAPAAYAAPMSP